MTLFATYLPCDAGRTLTRSELMRRVTKSVKLKRKWTNL